MKITQISVFLENTRGRLYEVSSLLGTEGINIRALTIAESPEFGILRIVVDRPADAIAALKKNNFVANLTEIVALEVDDRPGGLAAILKLLTEHGLNVEYMYGFVEKFSDKALLVFRFDDPDRALDILSKGNIKIVGNKDLGAL